MAGYIMSLLILFVLYFYPYNLEASCSPCTMSCSSVQQLHFVKLYDLFCVRLFRARLDPREPLHGTIPSQIACVIDITFDYVERFLGGFLRRRTGPQLAHIFNKK